MTTKTILLLSLDQGYDFLSRPVLTGLQSRATVTTATTASAALSTLTTSPPPDAVFVADAGVKVSLGDLPRALVAYAHSGGRVVFAGAFPNFAVFFELNAVFAAFGLPWERSAEMRSTSALNEASVLAAAARGLPREYYVKARFLRHVAKEHQVYVAEAGRFSSALEGTDAFAAFAPVGQGFVGYLGDVKMIPGEEEAKVVLAMCGVAEAG